LTLKCQIRIRCLDPDHNTTTIVARCLLLLRTPFAPLGRLTARRDDIPRPGEQDAGST
jgi:hypothetical protein